MQCGIEGVGWTLCHRGLREGCCSPWCKSLLHQCLCDKSTILGSIRHYEGKGVDEEVIGFPVNCREGFYGYW